MHNFIIHFHPVVDGPHEADRPSFSKRRADGEERRPSPLGNGNGTPCRPAYDGLPPPAFRENRPATDKGRFLPRPAGILPRIVSGLLKYFVILDAKRTDSEHLNNHNFKAL